MLKVMILIMLSSMSVLSEDKADSLLLEYFRELPRRSMLIAGKVEKTYQGFTVVRGKALSASYSAEGTLHYIQGDPETRSLKVFNPEDSTDYYFFYGYNEDIYCYQVFYKPTKLNRRTIRKTKKLLKQFVQELGYTKNGW